MRARLNVILVFLVCALFSLALWKGYTRGGQDFRVFDAAARLALEGKWDALYWEGPDRYLYAPGFAILFSPLSLLPTAATHLLWLALTANAFASSMRALARRLGTVAVCVGILFSMRAIWIDLRYGQVNLLILSAAVWALLTFIDRAKSPRALAASWFVFGIAAISKLYPVALLAFPAWALFLPSAVFAEKKRSFIAVAAALAGVVFVLALPSICSSGHGSFLFGEWMGALTRKGFPTETHNQSLPAFLFRMFSGEPFTSLGLGPAPLRSPLHFLGTREIQGTWLLFNLGVAGLFLRAVTRARKVAPELHVFLGLALCFLPAHLIWKSYFLLAIPLVAVVAAKRKFVALAVLGTLVTLSSNSIIGHQGAAWAEAMSLFLWVHLSVLALAYSSETAPTSA